MRSFPKGFTLLETLLLLLVLAGAFTYHLRVFRAGNRQLDALQKERLSYDGASLWRP